MTDKVKILIVDDSVTYRQILVTAIGRISDAECVGVAASGQIAIRKTAVLLPDLLLLDVVMPDMDGVETLQQIKQNHPSIEAIMMSAMDMRNTKQTLRSLQIGALDFIAKPTATNLEDGLDELVNYLRPFIQLVQTKKYALQSRKASAKSAEQINETSLANKAIASPPPRPVAAINGTSGLPRLRKIDLCVIGISTGGPKALDTLIPQLNTAMPCPIIIVQHMPPLFTESLAMKLDASTTLTVCEVKGGEKMEDGHIYIAQGGKHLLLRKHLDGHYYFSINENEPVNNCRPSVDVLFRSVAATFKGKVLAVVMTGMGRDGTEGVRLLKQHGAKCLVQDEESSIVWGMPGSVHDAGLADEVVPLYQLAARISTLVG